MEWILLAAEKRGHRGTPILTDAVTSPREDESTWAGICHGVAAASTLVSIPEDTVRVNGVEFFPFEVKAVAAQLLTQTPVEFFGMRNNSVSGEVDSLGRPKDAAFRDTNPGTLHLLLSNVIGLKRRAVLIDSRADESVLIWPVYRFESTNLGPLSSEERTRLTKFNPNAVSFEKFSTQLWLANSHLVTVEAPGAPLSSKPFTLTYLLELSAKGEIVGGEWMGESVQTHPDFAYTVSESFDWKSLPGTDNLIQLLEASDRRPFDPTHYLDHPDATPSFLF